MSRVASGFDELSSYLKRLPQRMAKRMQAAVIANHLDHRSEIIRSSSMSEQAKRNMKFVIRVFPGGGGKSGRSRVDVNRLEDVTGETVSFWKGAGETDPARGAAARTEKSIGAQVIRPIRDQYLLIPQGDFITPSGRPRRTRSGGRMMPIDLSKLPGTRVVRIRGKLMMIQTLAAGALGEAERKAAREKKIRLGTTKRLARRERVVGVLVKQAKAFRGLDFFGSWDRLASKRTARYDRVLDDAIADK
jgi:hypothetical protein